MWKKSPSRERMIPVVNSVIGSQCWLCERNIFIVLITLRFTQTLSCHLIWLVGRCIELGWAEWGLCVVSREDVGHSWHRGMEETRHQETPGVRRGQWAQWHRVTRTRVTCHTQWHDLVRLSHTSLTQTISMRQKYEVGSHGQSLLCQYCWTQELGKHLSNLINKRGLRDEKITFSRSHRKFSCD